MKLQKYFIFNVIIAIVVSTLIFILSEKGPLKRWELANADILFRLRGPSPQNPNIVIIEIDDTNITKIGRWPWKRVWLAAIVKALKDLGAQDIYCDIIFSEPSTEEDDETFGQAIEYAKNVYLPFVFQERNIDLKSALMPIDKLATHMKGTGTINIIPDLDGSIRKIPLFFIAKDKVYPHIALKLAMDYAHFEIKTINSNSLTLANEKRQITIPLTEENKMTINWMGKWRETFKHYSFLDILNAYQNTLENQKPSIDITPLKNSICFVAVTAIGLYDIKPTPMDSEYPAVGAIASTVANILDNNFIKFLPPWVNWLSIYILALIPALLISGERPIRETLPAIPLGFAFWGISFILFKKNILFNPSFPLLSFVTSYVSVSTYNFIRISMDKQRFFKLAVTDELTNLYNIRYFKMILQTECLMAKADPIKKFCVIMTDVDHFKRFNDTYGHQVGDLVLKEVAAALRSSVRSSDIVARYGGEEMIILLRSTSLENALLVAEKVRKNVENRKVSDKNNTYNVTISLGVSKFNSHDTADAIIKRADDGLYKGKENGRNRVETVETAST